MTSMRSIVFALVVAVPLTAVMQSRSEAMLVPVGAVQDQQQVNRSSDLNTIQTTLESKVLRAKLHALGMSDAEIQTRLTRLSDAQIHQLASQIRAVHPAGDLLIGILIVVVLVLLVIYLFKRI